MGETVAHQVALLGEPFSAFQTLEVLDASVGELMLGEGTLVAEALATLGTFEGLPAGVHHVAVQLLTAVVTVQ